jgi:hypothetical protein
VLATNIITFALMYWEFDGGGPRARGVDQARPPDFLFPQATEPALAAPGWRPLFADYLYVAFTNIVAFSPTDTMPLTQRAKVIMGFQSVIALLTIGIVVARAVNALR